MSHDGVRLRSLLRSVAILTAGALAVPALAGCGADDDSGAPAAAQDIAPAARGKLAGGGTVHWAVDAVPQTLNAFQTDADAATARIAGAVLPAMFRLDARGRPQRDADYLQSAKVVDDKPKQVVLYKLGKKAVWSDGRRISAADFTAQWHALSGKEQAFWTARNAGYDRIERIRPGSGSREVRVTFSQPYADWRSLFTPLYPRQVMGSPDAFNDSARRKLKATAGPFTLSKFDAAAGEITLKRSPRWWGKRARLSAIVFRAVPQDQRVAALAAGRVDIADVDTTDARRITRAGRTGGAHGPLGRPASASASGDASASAARDTARGASASPGSSAAAGNGRTAGQEAVSQAGLRHIVVRKSLEPSYTQLALNGASGPLADERVRRAVARAIDRDELADLVLKPLGLPAKTVGSHLALAGQDAYADGSGALGGHDTAKAQALLSDAGWVRGGAVKTPGKAGQQKEAARQGEKAAGGEHGPRGEKGSSDGKQPARDPRRLPVADAWRPVPQGPRGQLALEPWARAAQEARDGTASDSWQNARTTQDGKAGTDDGDHGRQVRGVYAPRGTAAPAGAAAVPLAKNGKPLQLRFVLPAGPGSEALRAVGNRISRMLGRVGIRTEMTKVADDSYFNDHIAAGQYDLALYSWPGSAFPATDARPIFAKPVPGADGSLNVEQNYTRVGTDHIDQLFDQALAELNNGKETDLVKKVDEHIWAEAGSIPLYQRPQLVAVRSTLANVGAFGFEDPRYENIGFRKPGAAGPQAQRPAPASASTH